MMMRKIFITILSTVFAFCLLFPATARAQGTASASVVDTTVYVSPVIRSAIDAWLAVSPPVALPYYAITYVHQRANGDTFVSLAALNIAHPTDKWRITDHTVAWMESAIVRPDYSVILVTQKPKLKIDFAIPSLAPGGGSDISFPWEYGKKMMYGIEGIHAAGGGGAYAVGFNAVDFLGGSDLGSGVASNKVYAAFPGVVDYVCSDPVTTLVRTADTASGNRFIYAHMLDNANLVEAHAFIKGQMIGTLKSGTFDDECGWADQTNLHYHLHFGFEMANNSYRIQNCILSGTTEDWMCGSDNVSAGEYLLSESLSCVGCHDGGISVTNPSFWDMVITGFDQLWSTLILANLPPHETMEYTYVILNTVVLVLKIAWVMVYSNVNLGHLAAVLVIALGVKLILGIAELAAFVLKAYKSIFPQWPGLG